MRATTSIALASAFGLLAACETVGGPGVSTYYECDRGLRLKVDTAGNARLVSVNGRRAVPMRPVAAAIEPTWEGGGNSLRISGDTATWTGQTREAPYTCRRVAVQR